MSCPGHAAEPQGHKGPAPVPVSPDNPVFSETKPGLSHTTPRFSHGIGELGKLYTLQEEQPPNRLPTASLSQFVDNDPEKLLANHHLVQLPDKGGQAALIPAHRAVVLRHPVPARQHRQHGPSSLPTGGRDSGTHRQQLCSPAHGAGPRLLLPAAMLGSQQQTSGLCWTSSKSPTYGFPSQTQGCQLQGFSVNH